LRNQDLGLIIHGHRAGHAAVDRNTKHGISMLVIAKIARLLGVDQLHIGTADIGKMSQDDDVIALENVLRDDLYHIKPSFPIASGGLHPGMTSKLVERMGKNVIYQYGGGCHGHPDGTKAGATAIRQSLEATIEGIPLEEYAEEHKELRNALGKWGIV
ncbi:MAG: RuBisCO large subunit C-terminal-like domain-containing protein, partial [Candidatus Altiarchaeales archaeon]|nr:RuBisCO large subunit C-terminal-like domain-containing protein [Candidatus Altiarchaeales archaeon]